ncbi:hypothetical protein SCUCBS95973_008839 [Sporothrix curviconia]|uniref:Heterokaryon incompatibility domain-containing protein n=1 Tax=Sporothrix curviconia TaxID=1260050 RepID=A0ABP0CQ02_9PEZI
MAFLCLLCHQAGHKMADCSDGNRPRGNNTPGPKAVTSFAAVKTSRDALCARCEDLHVMDLLLREDVVDELDTVYKAVSTNLKRHRSLGPYRDIVLVDTCPLCRLLFGIFPPEDADIEPDADYLLKPLRTYNRLGGVIRADDDDSDNTKRNAYGVSLSILARPMLSKQAVELLAMSSYRFIYETSFGIASSSLPPTSATTSTTSTAAAKPRQGLPARPRAPVVDYSVIQSWLHRCDTHHPDCTAVWVDELLTTSMIDVQTLSIVPCPANCRYLALSYVWGHVVPEEDALTKGTLPATITDAIEATKKLGFRYLWVDALCIDQDPTSPAKMQQLGIMDRIYAGAYATLVAFYGDSSLFGLRGSTPERARPAQPHETLVDPLTRTAYDVAAMYPTMAAEWEFPTCTHKTRAWTLQEEYLSQRLIMFGKDQVHYRCQNVILTETVDETRDPSQLLDLLQSGTGEAGDYFRELSKSRAAAQADAAAGGHKSNINNTSNNSNNGGGPSLARRRQMAAAQYVSALDDYTSRNMARDTDSLNACLGMLSFLKRMASLQDFVWGLPLRDFPLSLMWCHVSSSSKGNITLPPPRRRADFPSWSFVGWQGEVSYILPENLLPVAEKSTRERAEMDRKQITHDLCIAFGGIDNKTVRLAGWTVRFAIQTAPFSTAYVPGTDESIGMLTQNEERHPTSLPSGVFDFVVVQRVKRNLGNGRFRHLLYLLMLDDNGGGGAVPSRRTLVQWNVEGSFIPTPAYADMLKRREDIQLV